MEEYYLMWLSRVMLYHEKKAFELLGRFGSAECVFYADAEQLKQALGIHSKLAQQVLQHRTHEIIDTWIAELEQKEIYFYSYFHPCYPYLLKQIYNPPLGIYVKGVLPEDDIDKVGVIGARKCSDYGASTAYRITKELGQTNIVVVSGMAKGIDGEAHKGILDGGGKTIAVLGCGIDVCYPSEHEELMARIIQNGCVLSEYPPGIQPIGHHFPSRNRIISGLCKMIVVVEAGRRSGTLITADLALEQGREVFVVPGNVNSKFSEGTNNLIKQGCPIVTESGDILFELGISYQPREQKQFYETVLIQLEPEEQEIYNIIGETEPITAEEIARKVCKEIQDVQYMLSLLEISGHIKKLPQSGYVRKIESAQTEVNP